MWKMIETVFCVACFFTGKNIVKVVAWTRGLSKEEIERESAEWAAIADKENKLRRAV